MSLMPLQPSTAMIELVAIEMAEGNNGGAWATHYTEDQKIVWRKRAERIIESVRQLVEEDNRTI